MKIEELHENYKLVSSNPNKVKEFRKFGLDVQIETGRDLPEVNGTDIEVILYKALEAGPLHIVEDTSLNIEGYDVGTNIRWHEDLDKFAGSNAEWITLLGLNTGTEIKVFKGVINGIMVPKRGNVDFGFDQWFQPNGSEYTLSELIERNEKDPFSARFIACDNFKKNQPILVKPISSIPKWTGSYQHS